MKKIRNLILILLAGMLISACGGGGGSSDVITDAGTSDIIDTTGANDIIGDTGSDTTVGTGTTDTGGTTDTTVQLKVDLSWTAPTTRYDDTFLTPSDLVGYRVYYGTAPDALQFHEEIVGASETAISITDLPAGTYYFAVTAYDIDGLESGFSEIVSKQISS